MTQTFPMTTDRIAEQVHILPVSIIDSHADRVHEFLSLSERLRLPLGWHYILDLSWLAQMLLAAVGRGATVLDAGAGTGLMQWWLADRGIDVISVDRMPRTFSRRLRSWCQIVDLVSGESLSSSKHAMAALRRRPLTPRRLAATARELVLGEPRPTGRGTVKTLEGDLLNLREIETESVDAVVSISSLEHNSPENLERIVPELMRVLKPGGLMVATLGAAKDKDWYHEPSSGWCYTDASLRRLFDLPSDCPSNFGEYDALFAALESNAFLRENLSELYFNGGNNGMPWGRWAPQYQSAGVIKVKS